MNTTTITVTWSEGVIPVSDIDGNYASLDDNGFYAILAGTLDPQTKKWSGLSLLYIGKAYAQTIRERIKQPHDAYTCTNAFFKANPTTKALIMTGGITQNSQSRITSELVSDVEACLIATNQPRCNTQSKYSYGGRSISITNAGGYYPLKSSSKCSD